MGLVELTAQEALALRMRSLLLAGTPASTGSVAEVVAWFGAMQAQDYASGLWSLGARLPSVTRAEVEGALERREALRTWPMRGTIHLVPAADAGWMVEVLGERALARASRRRAYLGLEESTAERAVEVLADALAGGARLTRAQCVDALSTAGIPATGQRAYHLLWFASQRGVVCIAPHRGSEQTFVRLDEWVEHPNRPDREEALATIARRYVRSHGPVTRRDFIGWTGLTAGDADAALSAAGDSVTTVDVDGREMLVAADALEARPSSMPVLAMPGFDEYLLGYKDRSLMVDPDHAQAIVPGGNGVFRATVVRAGRVVATWKRTAAGARTVVAVSPLVPLRSADRRDAEEAFDRYGHFLGVPVEVRWP